MVDVDPSGTPVCDHRGAATARGRGGKPPGSFRIDRFGSLSTPLTVHFTAIGTATVGEDCNDFGTSLTIPAGSRSATITVTPKDDADMEGSEAVFLKLAPGRGYAVGTPSGAGVVIEDNDTKLPIVTVSAHDLDGGRARQSRPVRHNSVEGPVPEDGPFQTEWNRENGKDYQSIQESVTFSDIINSNVAQIIVTPIDDSVHEDTRTVTLTLMPSPEDDYAWRTAERLDLDRR